MLTQRLRQVIADFTVMDDANKKKLLNAVDRLEPLMSTNLWDGLQTGMDLVISAQAQPPRAPTNEAQPAARRGKYTSLFLLTDGMPNVVPPSGHIPALRTYLDSCDPSNAHSFTIHTFGFGYSIDTPLLLDIAKTGGGGYNFIPDAGMVGTVFVNAVATAYATYAQHVKVEVQIPVLDPISPRTPKPFKMQLQGQLEFIETNRGVLFSVADIAYGQPKYYVLDITPSFTSPLHAFATYRPVVSNVDVPTNTAVLSPDHKPTEAQLTEIEYRSTVFTFASVLLNTTSETRERSAAALEDLKSRLTTKPGLSQHPNAEALARDIGGESKASLATPENFDRWGKHWGSSYANAHQRQHCTNFKDKGLQTYGSSPVMQRERFKLEEAFHTSPNPLVSPPDQSVASPPSITSPSQVDISPASSTFISFDEPHTPSSLDHVLGRTPSPSYQEMRRHHAQYASDSSSVDMRRSTTTNRLKTFLYQREQQQQQSPLAAHSARFQTLIPAQQPDPNGAQHQDRSPVQVASSPSSPSPNLHASPMSRFYNIDAPCYTADCVVRTPGDAIRVDQLKRGVAVQTLAGPRIVAAVVRTRTHGRELSICRLGELLITPWHPIMVPDTDTGMSGWVFPTHVMEPELVSCDALYSVLLEPGEDVGSSTDAHSICVSDVWTVTLGHGIVENAKDVRAHAFFGDYNKVSWNLSKLPGFVDPDGVVECEGVRRGADGKICGFAGEVTYTRDVADRRCMAVGMVAA